MNKKMLNDQLQKLRDEINKLSKQIEIERNDGNEENPTLQELLDKKDILLGELEELESTLENPNLLADSQLGKEYCLISDGNQEKCYTIVTPAESAPNDGYISSESPLGLALKNKKKGDVVEISTLTGKTVYKVKSIK